jgi:SSS family transporter
MSYTLDLAVIFLYFVLIIGIGLWSSRGTKTVDGFTLGHRGVAWWAVLASILASEISAATFLGAPNEGYTKHNWTYVQLAIGTVIARIIVSLVFIPAYYRQQVTSIYEFLETRFGSASRKFGSATFMLTRVLAMGTRLYVSAIIIVMACAMYWGRAVTPDEKFWLYSGGVVLVTALTALYTISGGIKAVIWTDFIQILILFSSIGYTVFFLLGKMPEGWATVAAQIKEPVFFETLSAATAKTGDSWWRRLLTEEYTLYTALIGSVFVTMATHGIDQDAVQRMLTAKNQRQSALATIGSGLIDIPVVSAFVLVGVMLSAYYGQYAPADLPKESREIFPYFILNEMPNGLRGLVTAGLLATAMGSLSTALNALGTSYAKDFLFHGREESLSEKYKLYCLRYATAVFALLIIIVGVMTAYYMSKHPDTRIIPLVLGIMGYTFGSLLGIFLVAIFTKNRGNDLGNIIAMLCGFAVVFFFSNKDLQIMCHFTRNILNADGIPKEDAFLILAFPWRITLGTLITTAVACCFTTSAKSHSTHH